ncbi:uncharacterized protein LOC115315777, partial [Ixodes scapularis]|uniref:uncharacterized protein LOC115315777 n=1 Tax=Ixodes scapularis TaxID=6945 RepID=UPI001A9F169F
QVEPHLARPSSPPPTAASLSEEAQVEPHLDITLETPMGAAASSRSTAGTITTPKRQGCRPKKVYSPRTKHTLDNLRKSQNRLRRNLFKASQKLDFSNLTRPQIKNSHLISQQIDITRSKHLYEQFSFSLR